MPNRRLSVSLKRGEALHVTRVAAGRDRLVYIITANQKLKYKLGRSRIAYIGTTKNGIDRVAQSAADWTDDVLGQRGVDSFDVRIVTCRPRQKVKTWVKLERAFLLVFREQYGQVPKCNTQGKNIIERDEFYYFAKSRLLRVLEDLS
ncbi:GIY-YIG nuclease family protein [Myxococcus xanthus]|nr:hypothetical protein MyxoNM_11885 [Myxococcus xanthus]SDX03260.1 hypothetical protein SAMN05444383_104653 [Myxococcus xanthus]